MISDYGAGTSSIPSYGPAVLRLAVGSIFVAHGGQKLFGLWGGGGLEGTAAFFAKIGLEPSYPLAVAAGVVEFGGGLLLILGAVTLFAALALTIQMGVAIWKVHAASGFFLPAGYEFNVALIGALICLMLTGPGALSIDRRREASASAAAAGRARVRHGNI
ncbi:MAG: DoxX family protein [Vicinamibacterales bacterium]